MKTKLEESKTCCCVDVGAVIDGEDCSLVLEEVFADKALAESRLKRLTEKAQAVASEPCEINSQFSELEGGVQLNATFTFCCQAESLIFQLGLNR